MAIGSNSGVEFNLSNIQDNQVLVYDAAQGVFINETAAVSANASVTGEGRNVGSTGVGLYKQNDSNYLEFYKICLLYTSPSPRDAHESRMPSSA